MSNNNHIILTDTEIKLLNNILSKNNINKLIIKRANLFLLLNENSNYKNITETLHISISTIKKLKLTYFKKGLNDLLTIKTRGHKNYKLSHEEEMNLISLASSKCPNLKFRWTYQLLQNAWNSDPSHQNKQISFFLIHNILKKHNVNLGTGRPTKYWLYYQKKKLAQSEPQ